MRWLFIHLRVGATAALLIAGWPSALVPAKAAGTPPADDRTILHVLNRIGFGARPGDVERVRQIGLDRYLDLQLHPDRIPDSAVAARLAGLETLSRSSRDLASEYFVPALQARARAKKDAAAEGGDAPARTPEQMEAQRRQRVVLQELSEQKILRSAFSDRQLEAVLTDFWFNHFNVFAGKGPTQVYLTEYERDAIRPHVLGKFRDLLEATATSPAML